MTLLEKYYEIAKKYCIPETVSADFFTFVCKIKNPFTKYEIEFDSRKQIMVLRDGESIIVLNLEPPYYTYFSYTLKYGKEISITKREIEQDFKLENFEKTLKSIIHLPSYVKYKIRKYLEKV